jgi:hypothetical protein
VVTVRSADGSEHEVLVDAEAAVPERDSELLRSVHESAGQAAVQVALLADPARIPVRIICGEEGCQPEYSDT